MPQLKPIDETAQRRRRLVPIDQAQPPQTNAREAFSRQALERLVGNITGLPDLALTAGLRMLTGMPLVDRQVQSFPGVAPERMAAFNQPLMSLPKVGQRVLPLPSGEQAVAGMQTAAQLPGALIRGEPLSPAQRFEASLGRGEQLEQEHPTATSLGGIFGEGLTLALGRAPGRYLLKRAGRASGRMARIAEIENAKQARAGLQALEPGARRLLDDVVKSGPFKRLLRGLGRAGETSFEGAVLAALDESDPLQAAAYGAGQQIAGSLALEGLRAVRRHPIIATVATTAAILQMLKQTTPGGRDRILESIEASFDKILIASALGIAAGLAGSGRLTGRRAEDFPMLADALTAVPRGAVLSLVRGILAEDEAGEDISERTLAHLASDPEQFTARERRRLTHALRIGDFPRVARRLALSDSNIARIVAQEPGRVEDDQ